MGDRAVCVAYRIDPASRLAAGPSLARGCSRMPPVSIFAIVMLTCAVLLVIGAEWPRLSGRLGVEGRTTRSRRRRKREFSVIEGEGEDDFAESVRRDLENLPVIEERDGRSRR